MKFNWKTFPSTPKDHPRYKVIQEWVKNHKAELQQRWDLCRCKDDLDNLVREILGIE